MSPEFDEWWNGDHLPPNPYRKDSPAYWAWAGWQMAAKVEREACAKVCEQLVNPYAESVGSLRHATLACATAIRARGQEPPR